MTKGYELVAIDQVTGEEELLCNGSMEKLSDIAAETYLAAEDDGYPFAYRIQPRG